MTDETGADQFLPVFRTPGDVKALKENVDSLMLGVDATVTACADLDDVTRGSWKRFYGAWRAFYAEKESWLHAIAQYIQTEKYQSQLSDWQAHLAPKCGSAIPKVQKPGTGDSDLLGTVRIVAICGAVIAGVVAVKAVTK